ncbi:MAG: DUF4340 domain-containing protein [Bacteroidales bacterium]|nr:DUF4340 domain-containing protein [Bacteroidales bacterium]
MKKNKPAIILTIILIAIAILLVWNNRYLTSLRGDSADFMVWDTATITKVFIADRLEHETLLERQDNGWTLNKDFKAHPKKIDQLMYTLYRVRVKTPVSRSSHDNIIKQMASSSTKVEIYQTVPAINLFNKIKLFFREKRTKVFYVGEATRDSSGTFMLREGADQAYIVYIPGFRGYISTRFTANPDDWRDHTIFHEQLANIQSVTIEFGQTPELGFRVDNMGKHQYQLSSLTDNTPVPFDTLKVINLLASFSDLRFESLLNNILLPTRIDSILHSPMIHHIMLTDKDGNISSLKTFGKKVEASNAIPYEDRENDVDRMFALINDDHDLVLIQNYVFDKVLKDINYYKAGNPIKLDIEHFQVVQ